MGNCIAVREIANKNPKYLPTYIDISNFIEQHKQQAQKTLDKQKEKLEKQIRRAQNGGYGSSEEEDQVIIDDLKEGDSGFQPQLSDAQKSMIKDNIQSQKLLSRQQSMNSDTSFFQMQDKVKVQVEKNNESHSDSDIYNYNSEDELEQFFGGTKSQKKQVKAKNILSSLIQQGEKPQVEQIKGFKNTIFKKEDSEEQPIGNVFSDNDASFDDKSPEFKKK